MYRQIVLTIFLLKDTMKFVETTLEEKILILSTKLPFSEEDKDSIEELLLQKIDWGLLINLSASCGILPLMAKNLLKINSDSIPRFTLEEASKRHQMEYTLNHLILWNEFKNIIKIGKQGGVPIMPIKGIILTEILSSNLGLRRTSDIDILVKKEHLPKIESELVNLEYILEPFQLKNRDLMINTHFHLPFKNQNPAGLPVIIELHWDILPSLMRIDNLVDDFWNNAVIQEVSGEEVLTLSYEDFLFESVIELYKDITGYAPFLPKRHFDISQILQVYGRKINWEAFIKKTESYGLRGLVYYALSLNKELFNNYTLPQEILHKLKPSLCKRIFISNALKRVDLLHKLRFSLFISEVILLRNRWKVLFLRLVCWAFPDIYIYRKTKRINYIVFTALNLFYRLLRRIFRNILNKGR